MPESRRSGASYIHISEAECYRLRHPMDGRSAWSVILREHKVHLGSPLERIIRRLANKIIRHPSCRSVNLILEHRLRDFGISFARAARGPAGRRLPASVVLYPTNPPRQIPRVLPRFSGGGTISRRLARAHKSYMGILKRGPMNEIN
jgi:hypothetical protein